MKPKVTENKRRTMGAPEPLKLLWRCKHYSAPRALTSATEAVQYDDLA